MSQYHDLADESMDRLLESLEEIVETAEGAEDWEVDYSVRPVPLAILVAGLTFVVVERCPHLESGRTWHICHQQAATQHANMAIFPD